MNFFDDDFRTSVKQNINIRLYCYEYAAASCFVKQQSLDCSSNDLTSNSNLYILRSFLLYLPFMLLILVNLYSMDLPLCWPLTCIAGEKACSFMILTG